jgi:hypothetical protein
MPYVVGPGPDSIRVFDAGTNLVQLFDRAGALLRSYRLDAPGIGGGRAFRADGWLAATIGGFDSALVMVLDAAGNRVADIGEPIVPPTRFYDFGAIKAEIRDGRVPDAFRNEAIVAWGGGGSLYLAFRAEPEVRRYGAGGRLLWRTTLDEPVLRAARERFIRRNIEEPNPARLYSLQYVADLEAVGGDLWLLLNTRDETDGLLLVLDGDDGRIRRRVTFPGLPETGPFAVDRERDRLYMAPRDAASILVFDLP